MTQHESERRNTARSGAHLSNAVAILVSEDDGTTRLIMAKLIDASPGGVGVQTPADLPIGMKVFVRANLRSSEFGLDISGEGRVAHSRKAAPGRFVIGLALDELSYARVS